MTQWHTCFVPDSPPTQTFIHPRLNTLWGSFEVQNTRLVEKMLRQYHAAPLPMGDPKGLDAVADKFARLPLLFMRFHGSSALDEVGEGGRRV